MEAACLEKNISPNLGSRRKELLTVRSQVPCAKRVSMGGRWAGEQSGLLALPLRDRSQCQASGSRLCGTHSQALLPQAVLHI